MLLAGNLRALEADGDLEVRAAHTAREIERPSVGNIVEQNGLHVGTVGQRADSEIEVAGRNTHEVESAVPIYCPGERPHAENGVRARQFHGELEGSRSEDRRG